MSFKLKTSALITLVTAVILILTNVFVYYGFKDASIHKINEQLAVKGKNLIDRIQISPVSGTEYEIGQWALDLAPDQSFQIVNGKGEVLYGTQHLSAKDPWYRYICHIQIFDASIGDLVTYTIKIYQNLKKEEQFLSLIRMLLILGTFAGIGLSALLSYWLAGRTIRPVRQIIGKVREIGIQDLHERLPAGRAQDEIAELAQTFNRLLQRIESGFERQKRFTADASHELRTPITIVEGHANMIKRWGKTNPEVLEESLDFILNEMSRMRKLTRQLLELAQLENPEPLAAGGITDARLVLQQLVKKLSAIHQELHIVQETPDEAVKVAMSEAYLQQVLLNLLDNAVKFTPENGTIRTALEKDGVQAVIRIADTGIGIPQESLPHIFDRFYKVDKSRRQSGSGLGLSITKNIVDRHQGTIHAHSQSGEGTTITLTLPLVRESGI